MAIHRTDRDRRIVGDRILARKGAFAAVHDVVAMIHDKFSEAHQELATAIETRIKEESEDQVARREREEAAVEAQRLYSWAFHQIDAMLAPSWDDFSDDVESALLKETLFPVGNPSTVAESTQLTVDGLQTFLSQVDAQQAVTYPTAFLERCQSTLSQLRAAIDNVTTEMGESARESDRVLSARTTWDRTFASLRDVTNGLLRLDGREGDLAGLFRSVPRNQAKSDAVPTTTIVDAQSTIG